MTRFNVEENDKKLEALCDRDPEFEQLTAMNLYDFDNLLSQITEQIRVASEQSSASVVSFHWAELFARAIVDISHSLGLEPTSVSGAMVCIAQRRMASEAGNNQTGALH